MKTPVATPAVGKLKSILVKLDDVVAEGQFLAILETSRVVPCLPHKASLDRFRLTPMQRNIRSANSIAAG
jgi:pyruvate/2-oxoglutarate dehydrogenase complex dihydrolipoamide acyltransferase (E2) component